jgi:glycosyltransferase 2 family protein
MATHSPKLPTRLLWRILRLGIGVVLVLILVPTFINRDFWTALASVSAPLVVLALLLNIAGNLLKAQRWGTVMRWRGIELPRSYLLGNYFIGIFFNNFLPSGLGGDAVRAYETARHTGRAAESVTTILIERGSGMLVVFGIGSLFALTVPNVLPQGILLLVHGLFIGALIGVWALWLDVTGRLLTSIGAHLPHQLTGPWAKLISVYNEFKMYRHEWRLFASVTWLSILSTALGVTSIYVLVLAYDQHVSFAAFTAFMSIASAIEVLPISLNGLGVREDTYVYFLGLLGVPAVAGLGVALLFRLIVLIQAAIGGGVYLFRSLRDNSTTVTAASEQLPDIH